MIAPTREEINTQARDARQAESNGVLDQMAAQHEKDEALAETRRSRKRASLETLLRDYDRATKSLEEKDAAKTRLEGDVANALAAGDDVSEKLALTMQTKRAQIELIPAKISQIAARRESLALDIREEFQVRFIAFERQFGGVNSALQAHMANFLRPLMAGDFPLESYVERFLVGNTRLHRRLVGLLSYIRQPMLLGDAIAAARTLIAREPEAAEILADAKKLFPPAVQK